VIFAKELWKTAFGFGNRDNTLDD